MDIFYTSPWIPRPWIAAHGHTPRGLWAAPSIRLGAVPEGACAFAQRALRQAQAQPGAAFVFDSACDQMRRAFDEWNGGSNRARAFLFNLPATWQTSAARRLFQAEMVRLGRFFEGLSGARPTASLLAQAVRQHDLACTRLLGLASTASARAWAEAVGRFHWDGEVDTDLSPTPADAKVPLAVVGGPMLAPYTAVLEAVEQAGGRVVLNGTDLGERSLSVASSGFAGAGTLSSHAAAPRQDPIDNLQFPTLTPALSRPRGEAESSDAKVPLECPGVNEPFDSLVDRLFDRVVGIFQRPNTRLYAWLQERLAARRVRGIVLWHFVGCDLWRAEAATLREKFGLPVLALDAEDAEQCTPREMGRIQAFIEMLR